MMIPTYIKSKLYPYDYKKNQLLYRWTHNNENFVNFDLVLYSKGTPQTKHMVTYFCSLTL